MSELPPMVDVESSNINTLGYKPQEQQLFVEFNNGDTWRYDGVDPSVFNDLILADSVGSKFHETIKGKYEGTQVTGTAPNEAENQETGGAVAEESADEGNSETSSGITQQEDTDSDVDKTEENSESVADDTEQQDEKSEGNETVSPDGNDHQTAGESSAPEYKEMRKEVSTGEAKDIHGFDEDAAANDGASSTEVASWSHGDEPATLFITMENGDRWKYPGAPIGHIKALAQSDNPTQYYRSRIMPVYPGEKVVEAA